MILKRMLGFDDFEGDAGIFDDFEDDAAILTILRMMLQF